MIKLLSLLTAFSFFYYGLTCLFTNKMVLEFRRFGLSNHQRILTGVLQLLGAVGLVLGVSYPTIGMVSSGGLTVLMLLGFATRVSIKDNLLESLPSFLFMLINGLLFADFYDRII